MRHSIKIYEEVGDDYGRVELVNYMGQDQTIIDAARVSYSSESTQWRDDADPKLLRYLIKNQHWSPFEHCTITWHIVVPLFVRGQWHRHRTWCLSGSNRLHFDLPGGLKRRGNQLYTRTIKEVYEAFHRSEGSRQRIQSMHLRCALNDEDPGHTRIVDIWSNGAKPVIEVKTEHRSFKATKEHQVLATGGTSVPEKAATRWTSLGEALELGMDLAVVRPNRGSGEAASDWDGEPGEDERWEWIRLSNLTRGTAGANSEDTREHGSLGYLQVQFERVIRAVPAGEEEVFDLEVEGPDHNFVCEGFVVHNSYNEVSRRYTSEDLRFYTPDWLRPQAKKNKQASDWEARVNPSVGEHVATFALQEHARESLKLYEAMLAGGVAREQARMVLPQNMYVRFYGTVNLRNALAFIKLREDNHAQWEIFQAAKALREHLQGLFPEALKAHDEVTRG